MPILLLFILSAIAFLIWYLLTAFADIRKTNLKLQNLEATTRELEKEAEDIKQLIKFRRENLEGNLDND